MLMKGILSTSAEGKDYREIINKRNRIFMIVFVLGILTLAGSIFISINDFEELPDFIQGLYTGLGAGLTFASIFQIIRNKKLLKNEVKIRRVQIKEQDERNVLNQRKAMQSAGLLIIVVSYVGMLVSCFYNMAIFWTLFCICIIYFIAYIISFFYFNRV